ncbi:hypothetical protein [Methylopila sp. Yamaguchi]|uniref:hypothetical protein n=1 Tax=Methylopila sp. Yamaguchi TaxID=1437817 RepID=UPI001FCE4D6D|nr:hypothetical protein [Methylopila sp. Yamaguchi]
MNTGTAEAVASAQAIKAGITFATLDVTAVQARPDALGHVRSYQKWPEDAVGG